MYLLPVAINFVRNTYVCGVPSGVGAGYRADNS